MACTSAWMGGSLMPCVSGVFTRGGAFRPQQASTEKLVGGVLLGHAGDGADELPGGELGELAARVVEVALDGGGLAAEALGDVLGGVAGVDEAQDFPLPRGERAHQVVPCGHVVGCAGAETARAPSAQGDRAPCGMAHRSMVATAGVAGASTGAARTWEEGENFFEVCLARAARDSAECAAVGALRVRCPLNSADENPSLSHAAVAGLARAGWEFCLIQPL